MKVSVTPPAPATRSGTDPGEIIRWALAAYPDIVMPSEFNLNGTVLFDLAVHSGYHGEVVFVDSGYHFDETLKTRDALAAHYPEVRMVTLSATLPDDKLPTAAAPCARCNRCATTSPTNGQAPW